MKNNLAAPVAILLAGAFIAIAVYVGGAREVPQDVRQQSAVAQGDLENMKPVSPSDHIRGDANAPVKIVEYSDTECPFCKKFQVTMNEVMGTYGKEGKVAWVYRHFPIDQLHPKARKEAVALECANEQGGNGKFWEYADLLYEVTPANNGLDLAELPKIAERVGLNKEKFNTCLAGTQYDAHIQEEVQNAQAAGARGTPWSIVVGPDGKKYPLSGAQPGASIKQLIDLALQEE